MGAQQSKVRITIPKETCCFPAFENEADIFETVKQIEDCHLQAVQLASVIGSFVAAPHTSAGHLLISAAAVLFTFLLQRLTTRKGGQTDLDDSQNNNGECKNVLGTTLEEALIDAKVSAAIAKKSVCELQAKLCVISNRYQRLLLSEISVEDRRLEVVPALQTCEEVLQLFHDATHVFRLNPLVSSPFLVTFAGIFVAIAELSLVLIPSYISALVGEMNLLNETLSMYQKACIQTRMDNIKFRGVQPGSMLDVVAGGMSADTSYNMVDACLFNKTPNSSQSGASCSRDSTFTFNSTMDEDELDNVYHSANEARLAYRNNLESEYSKFFSPAVETISKFSGFQFCTSGSRSCSREHTSSI